MTAYACGGLIYFSPHYSFSCECYSFLFSACSDFVFYSVFLCSHVWFAHGTPCLSFPTAGLINPAECQSSDVKNSLLSTFRKTPWPAGFQSEWFSSSPRKTELWSPLSHLFLSCFSFFLFLRAAFWQEPHTNICPSPLSLPECHPWPIFTFVEG